MNVGRLVVNEGLELDLSKGIPFPLNYSIADIKEPQKRKRNFSRTVDLVGTQTNLDFFKSAYSLSLTSLIGSNVGFDFDPSIRIPAKYYKGSTLVFNGLMQLNSVKISNKVYYFNITLHSDFLDLFTILGDTKISELGWSEYNHQMNRTNVKNSWNTSVIINGVATPNFTTGVPNGFGYVYQLVDYGYNRTSPTTWKTTDIMPCVYAREVYEKCLKKANQTFTSNLLNTNDFKRLTLGFGGGEKPQLNASQINQRRVLLDLVTTINSEVNGGSPDGSTVTIYNSIISDNLTDNQTGVSVDALNQYNTVGNITCVLSGSYSVELNGTFSSVFTYVGGGSPTFTYNNSFFRWGVFVNGSQVGSWLSFSDVSNPQTLNLLSGDEVEIRTLHQILAQTDGFETPPLNVAQIYNGSIEFKCISGVITDGNSIELSNFIPDMKAIDFIRSINLMFNLYFSDPDLDGAIKIEPLSSYYLDTNNFDDWTEILDHSKDIEIQSSGSIIEGKNYNFNYEDEKDYYHLEYQRLYGQQYGNKIYKVESTFQKGDVDFKVNFGLAIPVQVAGSSLVVPRIISIDQNNIIKPFKGKAKIYFYNGLKNGNWRLTDNNTPNVTNPNGENLTKYPSCHHFNNWQSPTLDLCFELVQQLFYTATQVTTANLFKVHHEIFIKEITSRESKVLTAYFRLNPIDIYNRNFAKLKMINGVLFRLNTITDFDSDIVASTKCELVKVIDAKSNKKVTINPITSLSLPNKSATRIGVSKTQNVNEKILSGGRKDVNLQNEKLIG
jgi:hypothetical protein